jgi:hypothetical protein
MFSQLTRYASQLDIAIEDAEMDIRMTYDTRGKLLLADVSPACRELTYVFNIKSPAPSEKRPAFSVGILTAERRLWLRMWSLLHVDPSRRGTVFYVMRTLSF